MAFMAKRQYPRSSLREGVRIRSHRGVEYATIEDLSAGGLKIYLDHDVATGTLLELSFSIRLGGSKAQEISVMGRVVRSIRHDMAYFVGIQFMDLSDQSRQSLQAMVDSGEGPF